MPQLRGILFLAAPWFDTHEVWLKSGIDCERANSPVELVDESRERGTPFNDTKIISNTC